MSLEDVLRKIDKIDEKYHITDMVLGFLAGFGVAMILVYSNPEQFNVVVSRTYTGVENLENLFENVPMGVIMWLMV